MISSSKIKNDKNKLSNFDYEWFKALSENVLSKL